MAGLAAVPRHHFEDVQGTCTHTLCATNAGVVDLDGVGHVPDSDADDLKSRYPSPAPLSHSRRPAVTVVNATGWCMGQARKMRRHVCTAMSQESILEKVRSIVTEQLSVDAGEVKPESNFQNDLGADSLDTVELVMALEEAFDIEIPDEAAEGIATVGDAVKYIEDKQA